MGRHASKPLTEEFQQAPTGTHLARCFKLVDIGTQHEEYDGKTLLRNKFIVFWELPNELMDDGKPFIVSKFYTNSLHKKAALRHDLEQWRGKAFTEEELERFDLEKILGLSCYLSVIKKPNGNGVKVGSVMTLPKGTPLPKPVNEVFSFWLDEFDREKFEALSKGIKELIEASDEYQDLWASDGVSTPF